ncbi:ATP-binding cassette domain-containing protein [Chloroflexota bacterium]
MGEKLVEIKDVTKSFGNVNALEKVTMHVDEGEIVGLIGDNGAGKSTLIKILSGVHRPDSGDIFIRGQKINGWSVTKAQAAGIETVYQDRALAVQQTVTENIFMGREITGTLGMIQIKKQHEEAERLMREIGFTSKVFSPNSVIATLSGGERQGVAIARALYFHADLIILDEPTTALSLTECYKVFNFMETAKARGSSVIFITHNIYHAYDVADRFVILDRGCVVVEANRADVASADKLVEDMQVIARKGMLEDQAAGR